MLNKNEVAECFHSLQTEEVITHADVSDELLNSDPKQKPEAEPERMPKENPGVQPLPKKKEDDDDDEDDDDEDDPFTETEIGDDPDEIKKRTPIMLY